MRACPAFVRISRFRNRRMARTATYAAKIKSLEVKIAKKQEEFRKFKGKKAKADYMTEIDISADAVLDVIKN